MVVLLGRLGRVLSRLSIVTYVVLPSLFCTLILLVDYLIFAFTWSFYLIAAGSLLCLMFLEYRYDIMLLRQYGPTPQAGSPEKVEKYVGEARRRKKADGEAVRRTDEES